MSDTAVPPLRFLGTVALFFSVPVSASPSDCESASMSSTHLSMAAKLPFRSNPNDTPAYNMININIKINTNMKLKLNLTRKCNKNKVN